MEQEAQLGNTNGCEGYARAGCFTCHGYNKDCFAYLKKEVKK